MKRIFLSLLVAACTALPPAAYGETGSRKKGRNKAAPAAPAIPKKVIEAGLAEADLIRVYELIGQSRNREALAKAEILVREYPSFQLAQLVYGDLLAARTRSAINLGGVPETSLSDAATVLTELRDEAQIRVKALRERPPAGAIPSQFLALSPRSKHAIAVDASRSRLYLFENRTTGLTLIADYYISVGKSGLTKTLEGDARTPTGVYFITSNLDPKSLTDFYGSGALPINYPNELDNKRGKTGSGIWLHGTPPGQFSRPPKATDGCVVLANPDLLQVIRTVEVRTTPVVISARLKWVAPVSIQSDGKVFENALSAWQHAKSSGDLERVLSFYSSEFTSKGKSLAQWKPALRDELEKVRGRGIELKDLSVLRWTDESDTMVVTFGEVANGTRTGPTKRQYWERQGNQWKIFYEGIIG
jgi:murein L,D-transpeptidase YafK